MTQEDVEDGIRRHLARARDEVPAPPLNSDLASASRSVQVRGGTTSGYGVLGLVLAAGIVVAFLALVRTETPTGAEPGPQLKHVVAAASGEITVCNDALLVGILRGDPRDDWVAWLEGPEAHRVNVRWPANVTARFSPTVVLLEGQAEVAENGDRISLGGGFGLDGLVFNACQIQDVLRSSGSVRTFP